MVTADVTQLGGDAALPIAPSRLVGVVLVHHLNAPAARALSYTCSLELDDVRAPSVRVDEPATAELRARWPDHAPHIPLDVVDAPFRDIGGPIFHYMRRITADEQTIAVVVMPELVVTGPARLLHNQRELYVKRLLLFEPRITLTSVPYHLE